VPRAESKSSKNESPVTSRPRLPSRVHALAMARSPTGVISPQSTFWLMATRVAETTPAALCAARRLDCRRPTFLVTGDSLGPCTEYRSCFGPRRCATRKVQDVTTCKAEAFFSAVPRGRRRAHGMLLGSAPHFGLPVSWLCSATSITRCHSPQGIPREIPGFCAPGATARLIARAICGIDHAGMDSSRDGRCPKGAHFAPALTSIGVLESGYGQKDA
jgi:hypothetical protein